MVLVSTSFFNNTLIITIGVTVPLAEVMCIFDADQVPNPDFFLKTVPLLDAGQDVGMVLSPQTFYNLHPEGDIFNHSNVAFWDYTQPGYDALGLISCTGTNFLVRSRAFLHAGGFPEWTLTEVWDVCCVMGVLCVMGVWLREVYVSGGRVWG